MEIGKNSSVISKIWLDGEDLVVRFVSNKAYVYSDVPKNVKAAVLMSDSYGKAFNEYIRGQYDYRETRAKKYLEDTTPAKATKARRTRGKAAKVAKKPSRAVTG